MRLHVRSALGPIALSGLLSAASPDTHAESVRWALCQLEQGCQFCELPVSHTQADLALSALGLISDAPGHTVTVMRNRAGEWTWYYDTRRPPVELHAYFGGSGAAPEGACPALPDTLEPRDGRWSLEPSAAQSKNCPAGLDAQLHAQLPMPKAGDIRFERPFRASAVLPGAAWVQTAPNAHVGSFVPAGKDSLHGRYVLNIRAEDAMQGELTVIAPIPGQAACEIRIQFDYQRIGDATP